MELLHIYGPDGGELPSVDLGGRTRSILVCRENGRLTLAETTSPGADVVAALVRNEDGWALASANPEVAVTAGPKSAPDMQLLPGLVCGIAGFSFRLERDQSASGCMLLWRHGRSKIVADWVVAGRNIVAENADGQICVNPPLAGDMLFEFFPTADGVDVVTGTGEKRARLSVAAGILFAVGGFEAMYLSAKDAAEAMKSSSPFSWPSRKPRRGLFLGLLLLLGLLALLGMSYLQRKSLRSQLATPQRARQVEPMFGHVPYVDAMDRETIYEVQFFHALPLILGADPSPIAEDFIRAGLLPMFTNNVTVARRVAFLRDVTEIQQLVRSRRWDELKTVLDGVDREMYKLSDALDFYRDAVAMLNFVTVEQPARVRRLLEGKVSVEDADREDKASLACLQTNNMFMTDAAFSRETAYVEARRSAILEFLRMAKQVRTKGEDATAAEVIRLADAFCALRDQLFDPAFASVLDSTVKDFRSEIQTLAGTLTQLDPGDANDIRIVKLVLLTDLASQLGVPEDETSAWRMRAKDAGNRMERRYQDAYRTYRLNAGSDRALAEKTLDEMIDIGFAESPYYRWALRERERISQK